MRFPSEVYHWSFYTLDICALFMSTAAVRTVRTTSTITAHALEKQSVLYVLYVRAVANKYFNKLFIIFSMN